MPEQELSATSGLGEALALIVPALDSFIGDVDGRPPSRQEAWQAILDGPLPERGRGAQATLEVLRDVVIPNGLKIGAPGFSGWVTTAPSIVPTAAGLSALVAGTQRAWLQPYHYLEELAARWLAELFEIPQDFQGLFTSGGAVANLIGLGAARQHAGVRLGVDPATDGATVLPSPRIYASSEVHHVIHRAAAVLGLGRSAVIELPTDSEYRLDVSELRARIVADRAAGATPIAVVASAGTVNTGAVDPIAEIADICAAEDVWLHVDGAYGLPGILDPAVHDLFEGVSRADSVAVDPHKWMATPIGCGAVFVRDRQLLLGTFTLGSAEYLEEAIVAAPDTRSQFADLGTPYFHFGVEQSAPSRGVLVWAMLHEAGAEGFRERVRRHNAYARLLADRVQESPVMELLSPVTLSICCFRYVPEDAPTGPERESVLNELNRDLLGCVQERGRAIPSGTELDGRFAIRPCFINPRTMEADVHALFDEVIECGAALWAGRDRS